uniref:Lebercilin n=1 Tax=Geotrypetes seraphini TaxID=260995 RepID=A0A6P8R6I3_GEOSA|nr:lebercilin [Geotrypetes seraphini]XP_033795739.1 lebercilin [Geotrypetes seraphini]XP_033795741.1 lebercilin [Geotrypetes seraphini]XP_033795742.1 lebercilin [Geotrypetes seraphini]XP_033795743.1 lebercilin [Geotrypetes seraphini]XP_033795744.1 lebercilin [Geotrypetes seraphini]XP_033795745.1 lebercilin [Geotrypetes seraphini]
MEVRGRTRSQELDCDRNSNNDKISNFSYSEDYEDATNASDQSPTPSSKSQLTTRRRKGNKSQASSTPLHNHSIRKVGPTHPSNKRGTRWGFRTQSLNKDPPAKDMDFVTKRVLSARLLKINELRNELTEVQIKLEDLQKENKTLKRLQFRQEKALNKFEDTENEISLLLSRHSNEIRTLRDRLRKSQERERITAAKLKDTEDELYRTKSILQRLKKLSEDKHLAERDDLARKLVQAEGQLDDSERRMKDLKRNLELSNSSFQRHLLGERKKAYEIMEENKTLQEELHRLTQKLKEKEKELDAKNIYAFRMSKSSPKKGADVTPRKKASSQNVTTTSVQTNEYILPAELLPSPLLPFALNVETEQKEHETVVRKEQENVERVLKEEADHLRQEREWLERKREREEKLKRDQEQQTLEEKAQKLRDEWEKEEFERIQKENTSFLGNVEKEEKVKLETEVYKMENERLDFDKLEERRMKEMLLSRMNEIDKENQGTYSDMFNEKSSSQVQLSDSVSEKKNKTYKFSESTQKLFNGLPVYGNSETSTKAEGQGRRSLMAMESSSDLAFGSYAPSFGKRSGRSSNFNQKSDILEEKPASNIDANIQKEKKSNLMEQLFGGGASASTTNSSKLNDSASGKVDFEASHSLPWNKGSKVRAKDDPVFSSEGKNINSMHRVPHASRPSVKVVNSLDDEIEEVVV